MRTSCHSYRFSRTPKLSTHSVSCKNSKKDSKVPLLKNQIILCHLFPALKRNIVFLPRYPRTAQNSTHQWTTPQSLDRVRPNLTYSSHLFIGSFLSRLPCPPVLGTYEGSKTQCKIFCILNRFWYHSNMIIGYARVSTEDQHLDAQITALNEAGAERIFADKISGSKKSQPQVNDDCPGCQFSPS